MPKTAFASFIPDHISYILLDAQHCIVEFAPKILHYVEHPHLLAVQEDLRDNFPELYGLEDIFAEILAGTQDQFDVKAINRSLGSGETVYLDLYFRRYAPTQEESYLLVLVENVTDKMALEQTLVQSNNETHLLIVALENARQYANTIIEAIAELLIVTDIRGRILRVNPVTVELLGYSVEELLGRSLVEVLGTEEAALLRPDILSFAPNQNTLSQRIEINCLQQQGEMIILSFSCSRIEQELNGSEQIYIYVGRDVTRDRLEQKHLAVQYRIARTLSEATSTDRLTQEVLTVICQQLGFEVGELWIAISRSEVDATRYPSLPAYPSSPLYLQRLHQVSPDMAKVESPFVSISDRVLLLPGGGLAGRVWEHRTPQWIYELRKDQDFGDKSFACQGGLRSGLGFPIMADGEVLGVMTFFSLEQKQHDPELLHIVDSIGQQLGQYIRRKQTENALKEQQQQTESLLLNILPESIATQLRQSGRTLARQFDAVTVLFADIVGFTEFASQLSPIEVVEILNDLFSSFDILTEKYKLEKIKTIGDAYMVVGGLPEPRPDHAQAIADMALGMKAAVQHYNRKNNNTLQLRIGIHSGAVVAGVIGQKKFIYDLWGDTVNIASRMESHGIPEEIQCSRMTYELLQDDDYTWEMRGSIAIKGKGEMTTYLLTGKSS